MLTKLVRKKADNSMGKWAIGLKRHFVSQTGFFRSRPWEGVCGMRCLLRIKMLIVNKREKKQVWEEKGAEPQGRPSKAQANPVEVAHWRVLCPGSGWCSCDLLIQSVSFPGKAWPRTRWFSAVAANPEEAAGWRLSGDHIPCRWAVSPSWRRSWVPCLHIYYSSQNTVS